MSGFVSCREKLFVRLRNVTGIDLLGRETFLIAGLADDLGPFDLRFMGSSRCDVSSRCEVSSSKS
jgi:hypothetical protein